MNVTVKQTNVTQTNETRKQQTPCLPQNQGPGCDEERHLTPTRPTTALKGALSAAYEEKASLKKSMSVLLQMYVVIDTSTACQ
jgi:hypothetical protein